VDELKIYTLDEARDILKVTRRSMYSYIKQGRLKAVKMGKYWRIPHDALKTFITEGTAAQK